jgi:hypothetical protein
MDAYTRELALAAGFKDHFTDRQTIPGAPLWINYQSDGGFGTNTAKRLSMFAPLTDLVMQTFISNSDSEDPEFLAQVLRRRAREKPGHSPVDLRAVG